MILIYDTETTGLPRDWNAPITDGDNWPRLVQLAWQLHDETGKLLSRGNHVVCPDGFTIPFNSTKIHGKLHPMVAVLTIGYPAFLCR